MVLAQHNSEKKSAINMDPTAAQYFLIGPSLLIGPGGLLLVVSYLFALPLSILLVGAVTFGHCEVAWFPIHVLKIMCQKNSRS
jgi:hypothetical protein